MAFSSQEAAAVRSALSATGLPLVPRLDEVSAALSSRRLAVLRADPGSGKSTLLPLALMASEAFSGSRILMLEPRRVAAVSVAARMADLLGERVGGRVGYSVRSERRAGPATRVEVVTEGLLVRRLLADPGLDGVGAVVFDEFHERSIHTDLALALCLDLRRLRPDLALLAMSATMDAARLAEFLAAADADSTGVPVPLIDCPGRPYPVKVEHRPLPGRGRLGEETAAAVLRCLSERTDGEASGADDVLVFLPGRREIEDAAAVLRRELGRGEVDVRALHGSLSLAEQREVLAPLSPGRGFTRRVILATNIAETSLTVPGVGTVVDSGMVRVQRFHLPTGLDRLVLERASDRSCDQRAGRAGRLGPGRCLRLWDAADSRPRDTDPEILRTDAASLVLDCALWGVRHPADLFWLDPPSASSWEASAALLGALGALDASGGATPRGERMSRLGVHPRLAAVALEGEGSGQGALACACAAALSDRDGSQVRDDADFRRRLALLRGTGGGDRPVPGWRERVADLASDLSSRLGGGGQFRFSWSAGAEADVGTLLLAGFPDRIARRQDSGAFRFPSGREVRVPGPLAVEEWLVAVDAEAGERTGTARLAVPVSREDALRALTTGFPESAADEIVVDWDGLVPRARAVRRAGRLTLSERRVLTDGKALAAAFGRLVADRGLGILPWDGEGGSPRSFLARARFWAQATADGDLAEAFSDEALATGADEWLGPFLRADGKAGVPLIDAAALTDALKALAGWDRAGRIEREAPERLETPAGTRRRLSYEGDAVFLEARIQEVFGLADTPRVAGVPVTLRLLSPAERPLQVTADLASFWRNTYPEVRKEMRGRYPRHYWPEDPLVAEPTSRPKPRGT